jgi:hypothetical protein
MEKFPLSRSRYFAENVFENAGLKVYIKRIDGMMLRQE